MLQANAINSTQATQTSTVPHSVARGRTWRVAFVVDNAEYLRLRGVLYYSGEYFTAFCILFVPFTPYRSRGQAKQVPGASRYTISGFDGRSVMSTCTYPQLNAFCRKDGLCGVVIECTIPVRVKYFGRFELHPALMTRV
eukprot:5000333-Pyramimonas_sp.AAC.1